MYNKSHIISSFTAYFYSINTCQFTTQSYYHHHVFLRLFRDEQRIRKQLHAAATDQLLRYIEVLLTASASLRLPALDPFAKASFDD
jgi:nicotinic acid phosphoribosyltransferase